MLSRDEQKETDLALTDSRCDEFLLINHLPPRGGHRGLDAWWSAQSWEVQAERGWTYERLREGLLAYLAAASATPAAFRLETLEIRGGRNKRGEPEAWSLVFRPGEVICLVGPTGAGKSRLLADIECLAQADTPTGRTVLVNGRTPEPETRFTGDGKLVAQISQNMNFVLDLSVGDFLELHAEARGLTDASQVTRRVLEAAVSMAGEPFAADTALTQLSGGQSRALMIADAAFLSPKPIVLIDEIENAGVDRIRALQLFVEEGKIVFLSTHDPLLAVSGTRRLVIRGGGVVQVIEPSADEHRLRQKLARYDRHFAALRESLRRGEPLLPASEWLDLERERPR